MHRRVFVERPVRPSSVVVARVREQSPAQMLLAADNDLVQAFATDGPNQALGETVLPW